MAICTTSPSELDGDGGGAAGVLLGVVEQVGDHPGEAALVDPHDDRR